MNSPEFTAIIPLEDVNKPASLRGGPDSGLVGGRPRSGGFALVVTVSILVLLAVIAVGLMTLSSVSIRNSTALRSKQEAQANARLALSLAIGELQKHTGLDQRVTAEADILSSDGFAGFEATPEKAHYVGAYSTEEWHERSRRSPLRGNVKSFDNSRNEDAFQRWLTSGDPEEVGRLDFAQSALDADESVQIVGGGSVGEANSSEFVRVPVDSVEDAKGRVNGRIGWWVGDQGVKAKVSLAYPRDAAQTDWEQRFNNSNPLYNGVSNIEGMENLDPKDVAQEDLARIISDNQLVLLNGEPVDKETLKERYHDVTTYSLGVLADVALGGLKRDLSIPFELPILEPQSGSDWDYPLTQTDSVDERNEDFTSMWEFSNSGDQNPSWASLYWPNGYRPNWWANKLGYCFMLPDRRGTDSAGNARYLRGPTWQMLRNHYRLYKREYEQLPSGDPARRGWRSPSSKRGWLAQPYQPYSSRHNSQGNHLLSTTYVGGRDGADHVQSPDVFDPFYSFGNNRGRSWNNLGFDTLGVQPVITKVALVLSHQSHPYLGGRRLELVMDAVGTVWNPYNAPIEFESIFTNIELRGLKWNFTRKSGGTVRELAIDPTTGNNFNVGREKQFPFQYFRFGVTSESSSNYPFDQRAPKRLIKLNPGECRTFAMNFGSAIPYLWANMTSQPGTFANNWEGGMFLRFSGEDKWHVIDGDTYEFELLPSTAGPLSLEAYLGYFKETSGTHKNPFDSNRSGTGYKDLPELASLHVTDAADVLDRPITKTLSHFTNHKEAICYIEFRRRASDDSPHGVLAEFDPRSVVNHSDSMGAGKKGSVPGNWDVKIKTVSDFDLMQAGIGRRNNGFWGSSHEGDGETHVVAFEIPDAPITNLAALQHCQTGSNGWDVSYAIGNSLPHPNVPLDQLSRQEKAQSPGNNSYKTTYYDMSYLANQGLWDRYFFSGLHLGTTSTDELEMLENHMKDFLDPKAANPLANKRLVLSPTSRETESKKQLKELTHYRWLARHMMLDGPANINSTRVEAWKAWLSSLKGEDIDQVGSTGRLSTSSGEGMPFSRASVIGGDDGELWRGYLRLSEDQIQTLAENIVTEVKRRGPFLSVADFVNRRLSSDRTGEMGALQAALEESGFDTGHGSEKGIPGTIRQGDILNSMGGVISARSDTFVIRAYGESIVPDSTGPEGVLAKAWCEVVVQRMPTLIDDNGELLTMPNPDYPGGNPAGTEPYIGNDAVSEIAKTFGREYRVLSFRWLSSDEV